jgi:hypothetical protein
MLWAGPWHCLAEVFRKAGPAKIVVSPIIVLLQGYISSSHSRLPQKPHEEGKLRSVVITGQPGAVYSFPQ